MLCHWVCGCCMGLHLGIIHVVRTLFCGRIVALAASCGRIMGPIR